MSTQTYIIAEAGVNHNGSLVMAKALINAAAEAGTNAVKFQTFKASNLVSESAPKAEYQKKMTAHTESQYEMLKRLELTEQMHHELISYCKGKNIEFLSTPFDKQSLELLIDTLNLPKIKIPSGEITNAPFLLEIARKRRPIILSTGMSTLGEVEQALAVIAFGFVNNNDDPSIENFKMAFSSKKGQAALKEKVTLLQCTTEYPTPYEDVNLRVMDTLHHSFQLPVGFSDHTSGIAVSIAAVARGAKVIEKHFTLDRNLEGPDHKASLEPNELKEMVKSIRQVERALGQTTKTPAPSEIKNISIARKSIVANRAIKKGEKFSEENITVKRSGEGLTPLSYWSLLGSVSDCSYEKDDMITK